jgi:hypothetical protein
MLCSLVDAIRILEMWRDASSAMWISSTAGGSRIEFAAFVSAVDREASILRVRGVSTIFVEGECRLTNATFEYLEPRHEASEELRDFARVFTPTVDATLTITYPDGSKWFFVAGKGRRQSVQG